MRVESVDLKELVFMVSGQGAYSRFKYESGVHRVQRILQQSLEEESIHLQLR